MSIFYLPSENQENQSDDLQIIENNLSKLSVKVGNPTSSNLNNEIVKRNPSGGFAAGIIQSSGLEVSGTTKVTLPLKDFANANIITLSGTDSCYMGKDLMPLTTGASNTVLGRNIGATNTVGFGNMLIGNGIATLGSGNCAANTAVGSEALTTVSQGGTGNTAHGQRALYSLTTGADNTAVGIRAGGGLITGLRNSFLGTDARTTTSALNNSAAIGWGAIVDTDNTIQLGNTSITSVKTNGTITAAGLESVGTTLNIASANNTNTVNVGSGSAVQTINMGNNGAGVTTINLGGDVVKVNLPLKDSAGANILQMVGTANVLVGKNTMPLLSSGTNNVVVGNNNGSTITSSSFNTLIVTGIAALGSGTTGWNTVVGNEALANVSTGGIGNVVMGNKAMYLLTSGENNTAIGTGAGYTEATPAKSAVTCRSSTFIGCNACPLTGALNNATAIGFQATVDANDTIQLGNTSVTNVKTSGTLYAAGLESIGTTLNIASQNNTSVLNLGSGTGVQTINMGNNGAGVTTISLGGSSDIVKVNLPLKDSTGANIIDIPASNCMIDKNVFNNLTSTSCTGVGVNIGGSNIAGNVSNTFFGRDIAQNSSGDYAYCTAVGHGALKNLNGWSNTAFGYNSLSELTTSGNNVGFGIRTGSAHTAITTGISNTFIGATAGSDNANRTNGTAVGYNARVDFDNCVQLGNTSVTQVRTSGILSAAGLKLPTTGGTAGTLDYYEEYSFVTKFNTVPQTADITFSIVRVGTVVTFRMKGDLSFIPPTASYLMQDVTAISPCDTQPHDTN